MSEEAVGIIALFVLYTIAMLVFMFAAFPTYTKVTNWFGGTLMEEGKTNGWDMKKVVLPLIARNTPLIIILSLFAEVDFMTTLVSYVVSLIVLKSAAGAMSVKKKA